MVAHLVPKDEYMPNKKFEFVSCRSQNSVHEAARTPRPSRSVSAFNVTT